MRFRSTQRWEGCFILTPHQTFLRLGSATRSFILIPQPLAGVIEYTPPFFFSAADDSFFFTE
jgi:hypothetical protein